MARTRVGHRRQPIVPSTPRTHPLGQSDDPRGLAVVGATIFQNPRTTLRAGTSPTRRPPKPVGRGQWHQVVPHLRVDQGPGFATERYVDYTRQVAKVEWGKSVGPENGVDRGTDPGRVSSGTQYRPRISLGYHSQPRGCPRRLESTRVLGGGWSVFPSEHELQLALCEFECQVSSHHGIRPDVVPVRALRCGHQPDGGQPNHRSFAGNQVSTPRDDSL